MTPCAFDKMCKCGCLQVLVCADSVPFAFRTCRALGSDRRMRGAQLIYDLSLSNERLEARILPRLCLNPTTCHGIKPCTPHSLCPFRAGPCRVVLTVTRHCLVKGAHELFVKSASLQCLARHIIALCLRRAPAFHTHSCHCAVYECTNLDMNLRATRHITQAKWHRGRTRGCGSTY